MCTEGEFVSRSTMRPGVHTTMSGLPRSSASCTFSDRPPTTCTQQHPSASISTRASEQADGLAGAAILAYQCTANVRVLGQLLEHGVDLCRQLAGWCHNLEVHNTQDMREGDNLGQGEWQLLRCMVPAREWLQCAWAGTAGAPAQAARRLPSCPTRWRHSHTRLGQPESREWTASVPQEGGARKE